jgi:acyl CoA:acetate/3-ketoacid CoA transferase alpha subunit
MKWIKKTFKTWTIVLVLLTGLVLTGCEGTDSREKVDDTVKEFSGQKNLERMEQMKKDIAVIKKQQADRLKKLQ